VFISNVLEQGAEAVDDTKGQAVPQEAAAEAAELWRVASMTLSLFPHH
jgi:hypothetical protein